MRCSVRPASSPTSPRRTFWTARSGTFAAAADTASASIACPVAFACHRSPARHGCKERAEEPVSVTVTRDNGCHKHPCWASDTGGRCRRHRFRSAAVQGTYGELAPTRIWFPIRSAWTKGSESIRRSHCLGSWRTSGYAPRTWPRGEPGPRGRSESPGPTVTGWGPTPEGDGGYTPFRALHGPL